MSGASTYGVAVITVGIDLASQPRKTGLTRVRWTNFGARVQHLAVGIDDDAIVEEIRNCDKAGIDCPFGWPVEFVDFVSAHREARPGPPMEGEKWSRRLALRATDRAVQKATGLWPLSVATDRIAYPAMRCVELLHRLDGEGIGVDLSGRNGCVVEVYPKASLHRWDLAPGVYKRKQHVEVLGSLLDKVRRRAPWLDLGDHEALCQTNDDAFDAVIAALTARAAALDLVTTPCGDDVDLARVEGWIAVPCAGSLDALVGE